MLFFIFDKNAVVSANEKRKKNPSQPFRRNKIALPVTKKYSREITKKNKNTKKKKIEKNDFELINKNSKNEKMSQNIASSNSGMQKNKLRFKNYGLLCR